MDLPDSVPDDAAARALDVASLATPGLYAVAACAGAPVPVLVVAAGLAAVFLPSVVIESVVWVLHRLESDITFPESTVARMVTGFAERGFIFLVVVTALFAGAGIDRALNFIAAVVVIKAIYRSPLIEGDGGVPEGAVEVYLVGSFLSIGLGTFLTWLLVAPLVGTGAAVGWLPC